MRLIGSMLRAVARSFARAWTWSGWAVRNTGHFRTLSAPSWRAAVRGTVVALGFAIFMAMQYVLAVLIINYDKPPTDLPLLPWKLSSPIPVPGSMLIAAFFITALCLVFAASRPTAAFVGWLILSPLAFIFLRMDFGEAMPAITFDRIALTAIGVFLLARTMLERHRIKKPILAEWLIVGFVSYTFLMVYALHPGDLKQTLKTISERFDHIGLALIAYYIAKSVLTTRKQLTWALTGLVITGVYVAASAFYEHYTGYRWFGSVVSGDLVHLGYGDVEKGRASGPLLNPAAMGTFLGITAFLSFHLFAAVERKSTKFLYLCATALQLMGCYFCFTRSGYVAALLLLVSMPFAAKCYRKQYATLAVAAAVVLAIALPLLLSNADVGKRLTQSKTVLYRLAITATTINIIKHHPWFGVGLGEIDHALQENVTNVGTMSGVYARGYSPGDLPPQRKLLKTITSHNSILTICAEQGLVGGLLFLAALIAFVVHLARVGARLPARGLLGRDLIAILVLATVGHVLSTLGYDLRFFKYPSYVLWILFAIGVRLGEILAEEKRAESPVEVALPESAGGLVHA